MIICTDNVIMSVLFWQEVDRRLSREYSRKALAADVGIGLSTIATAKARGSYPTADVAVRIASRLGTSVEELVTGQAGRWKPPSRIADIVEDLLLLDDQELGVVRPMVHGLAVRHVEDRKSSGG